MKQSFDNSGKYNIRKRIGKTVSIGSEIDNLLSYYKLDDKMEELKILEVWKECVGEAIAKYSRPVGLKNNKLMVSAETAVWRYELSARKEDIIEKINKHLHKKEIKEIVFI